MSATKNASIRAAGKVVRAGCACCNPYHGEKARTNRYVRRVLRFGTRAAGRRGLNGE